MLKNMLNPSHPTQFTFGKDVNYSKLDSAYASHLTNISTELIPRKMQMHIRIQYKDVRQEMDSHLQTFSYTTWKEDSRI